MNYHYILGLNIDASLLTFLGAIGGGALLKLAEYFVTRGKAKVDESTAIRMELREQIKNLTDERDEANEKCDTWRERYYALVERHTEQSATLRWAVQKLNDCQEVAPEGFRKTIVNLMEGIGTREEMQSLEGALKAESELSRIRSLRQDNEQGK
jgi:hypothetical protein